MVADAVGGMHIIHTAGGSGALCGGAVHYGYCASNCGQAKSWNFTSVAGATASCDENQEVSAILATDAQGHPRILSTTGNGANYSECNGNCTTSSNWKTVLIPTSARLGDQGSEPTGAGRRFFAVAPAGGAAFAYSSPSLVYVACASDCTNVANWHETAIVPVLPNTQSIHGHIAVAIDAQNRPRVSYYDNGFDNGSPAGLSFAACDSGCDSPAAWTHVLFEANLSWAEPVLALDAQGRPRIYAGVTQRGNNTISGQWTWCDSNCTASPQSWQGPVPVPRADSMSLDAAGNPHFVAGDQNGVNHTWCAGACTSTAPMWQETSFADTELGADWTTDTPLFHSRSIAIDASGAAFIAADAWHYPSGLEAVAEPDAYGVFLRFVPASTEMGNPVSSSGASGSGSASSGTDGSSSGVSGSGSVSSGSSGSSGSGSSGSSGSSGGSDDGGANPFANFVGAPWSGSETDTLACRDAGSSTTSVSWTFQPSASGFTFQDQRHCSWSFTVSGDTATLASTPQTCAIGPEVLSVSSATLTTSDGHTMSGQFTATETLNAMVCPVDASIALTR